MVDGTREIVSEFLGKVLIHQTYVSANFTNLFSLYKYVTRFARRGLIHAPLQCTDFAITPMY